MSSVTAAQVRAYLLARYEASLIGNGVTGDSVGDDFDLLTEGVIDSFGILEMVSGMEEHFGIEIDYEAIDPQDLTVIGPLSRFVESQVSGKVG